MYQLSLICSSRKKIHIYPMEGNRKFLGKGISEANIRSKASLVPRVLRLFGQWVGTRRDSGVLEFCYRRISAVKQCKLLQDSQSKSLIFSDSPESLLAPTHWPKSQRTLGTRLKQSMKLNCNFLGGGVQNTKPIMGAYRYFL